MAEHHSVPKVLSLARDLVYKVQALIENKWRRMPPSHYSALSSSCVPSCDKKRGSSDTITLYSCTLKRKDRNTDDSTGRFVTTAEYSAVVIKQFFWLAWSFFRWYNYFREVYKCACAIVHSVNGTLLKEKTLQDIHSFALDWAMCSGITLPNDSVIFVQF